MSRLLVGVALAVVVTGAGCFRQYEPPPATTTLTSATVPRSGDSISDRIARALCVHEVECGRVRDPDMCVDASRMRVARELGSWTCDADSARIGAEQCLASLRGAACAIDLSAQEDVCSRNGGCATVDDDRPAASR